MGVVVLAHESTTRDGRPRPLAHESTTRDGHPRPLAHESTTRDGLPPWPKQARQAQMDRLRMRGETLAVAAPGQ